MTLYWSKDRTRKNILKRIEKERENRRQTQSIFEAKKNVPLLEQIGKQIADQRLISGLTQQQFASLVRTSQPNISRLESGSGNVSINFLTKVTRALKFKLFITID